MSSINRHWCGDTIDELSIALSKAQEKLARQHPEMLRQCAVAALNVANRATPPNTGGRRRGVKQTGYGQTNVKALKLRIAAEITGVEKIKPDTDDLPSAQFAADGWGSEYRGPEAWGGYGFRVLRPSEEGAPLPKVKYVDPWAVLRQRKFRRKGDVVRAVNGVAADGIRWVKPADLKRAVAEIQSRAGRLITAWLPAARTLHASNAARDYAVSKFRRSGSAKLRANRLWSDLVMKADWGSLIVARRYAPWFLEYVGAASYGPVQKTAEKFVQNLFR